jgi:hypothetical protein
MSYVISLFFTSYKHIVEVLTAVGLPASGADALGPAGGCKLVVAWVELLHIGLATRWVLAKRNIALLNLDWVRVYILLLIINISISLSNILSLIHGCEVYVVELYGGWLDCLPLVH